MIGTVVEHHLREGEVMEAHHQDRIDTGPRDGAADILTIRREDTGA